MHTGAQAHYDVVAALSGPPNRSRLQKFHNAAKRALLAEFASSADSVLDLACGRGGDVHKWLSLGVKHVTGLDVSSQSVTEAERRFHAAVSVPAQTFRASYQFFQADLTKPWTGVREYDIVTCMFALHYFFVSEEAAHTLMRTVATNLRPGGVFVGIVPDGQRVNDLIKHGPKYDNGVLRVHALWPGQPACFGSAYTCNIRGTVTQGSEVPEYLVYDNVLKRVAAMHGLTPVPITNACFSPPATASPSLFHHVSPPYTGPEGETSRLFAGFALKKFCSHI